eukprot:gnl/TRDRNA2_/TRDRNA2_163817_c0_seq1.p1 gnl/TRDRNA2_/TRDRNA2_163817_c0~~gnl/TRDRNA2_/TRDRNA2_163817_c0_seq1.p1  ORF type:complete len:152 (-),score=7.18 gnl/TRDRNA2_/TRDRNA2_163817_c0_seq1:192-599(-)
MACDVLVVDTKPMDIAFADPPPITPCDTTPVSNYPCIPGFVAGEYTGIPHTKPCNAPPSCAGTPHSSTPSPTPPPCSRPSDWCVHAGTTYTDTVDCDGDGVPDPLCTDDAGDVGFLGSASSCVNNWPTGQCPGLP